MAFAIIIPIIFLMRRLVYFQLSIFSIVYTNIYTLSIFPVTYSLLCVISYLRLLFTPGCTSNNSNAKCVWKIRHIRSLYTCWDSLQGKLSLKIINSTNSDWSSSFFTQVGSNRLTNHKPKAKFFTSEKNRIGFPAFSGAAACQNEWKWILAKLAAF